ncbi:MAG: hypothetical protein R3C10_20740 [Pirellulales bacterium]
MLRFHMRVHSGDAPLAEGPALPSSGGALATVRPTGPLPPLAVTFDDALAALGQLARLDVEPDGFFTWVSARGPDDWKLEGQLVDAGPALMYVELKGRVPGDVLDDVLTTLGWPAAPLVFELVRAGVFLAEPAFRRWAEGQ